jgi:hypothetical protein
MKLTRFLIATVFLMLTTAAAQAEVIYNAQEPFAGFVFIPCANDGDGEGVLLEGRLHVMIREEIDEAGGYHWGTHFQPMGASGYGDVTGDRYQATGGTFDMYNDRFPGCPFEYSFQNNYKIIGQGSDNNYLVHENYHVVIDADCNLTIERENSNVECR